MGSCRGGFACKIDYAIAATGMSFSNFSIAHKRRKANEY